MGLFTFIVCFLILLLIVIVVGTLQQLGLIITTRKCNEFVVMIIPALMSLLAFALTLLITNLILKAFNINSLNMIYSMFMNWEYSFSDYIATILACVIFSVAYIIIQAFCLKLVNINYYTIWKFIKHKIFKKEEIKTLEPTEEEKKVSIDLMHVELPVIKPKTSFLHYFAASLFTYALSFSSITGLIYLGILLGKKYII